MRRIYSSLGSANELRSKTSASWAVRSCNLSPSLLRASTFSETAIETPESSPKGDPNKVARLGSTSRAPGSAHRRVPQDDMLRLMISDFEAFRTNFGIPHHLNVVKDILTATSDGHIIQILHTQLRSQTLTNLHVVFGIDYLP